MNLYKITMDVHYDSAYYIVYVLATDPDKAYRKIISSMRENNLVLSKTEKDPNFISIEFVATNTKCLTDNKAELFIY